MPVVPRTPDERADGRADGRRTDGRLNGRTNGRGGRPAAGMRSTPTGWATGKHVRPPRGATPVPFRSNDDPHIDATIMGGCTAVHCPASFGSSDCSAAQCVSERGVVRCGTAQRYAESRWSDIKCRTTTRALSAAPQSCCCSMCARPSPRQLASVIILIKRHYA